ncbi:hypothetical protein [Alkalilacustris brevis]|uniref:hypothetical protein n=1 Tax=Alkalilacustris brevis TaxID=2026338 RepID=UPI000E0DC97E|nr:hypothetical protein [Alkalilacustris brevis]
MTDRHDKPRHTTGEEALERELARLGRLAPQPGPDLVARVLADADALQAQRHGETAPVAARARPAGSQWWHVTLGLLGGRQGLAGLATVALAGFWIGADPPAPITALESAFWGVSVTVEIQDDPLFTLED